jgi:hypothetical protein
MQYVSDAVPVFLSRCAGFSLRCGSRSKFTLTLVRMLLHFDATLNEDADPDQVFTSMRIRIRQCILMWFENDFNFDADPDRTFNADQDPHQMRICNAGLPTLNTPG